jgi:hypothetical protein
MEGEKRREERKRKREREKEKEKRKEKNPCGSIFFFLFALSLSLSLSLSLQAIGSERPTHPRGSSGETGQHSGWRGTRTKDGGKERERRRDVGKCMLLAKRTPTFFAAWPFVGFCPFGPLFMGNSLHVPC